jgi:hypothetical protein
MWHVAFQEHGLATGQQPRRGASGAWRSRPFGAKAYPYVVCGSLLREGQGRWSGDKPGILIVSAVRDGGFSEIFGV